MFKYPVYPKSPANNSSLKCHRHIIQRLCPCEVPLLDATPEYNLSSKGIHKTPCIKNKCAHRLTSFSCSFRSRQYYSVCRGHRGIEKKSDLTRELKSFLQVMLGSKALQAPPPYLASTGLRPWWEKKIE